MRRSGFADLPLHGGQCPPWLFERMKRLGGHIIEAIVALFGPEEFLRRIADPVFFQSLGCLLGFDWHSSGLTTTLCGALKEAVRGKERDLGLYICGGKGGTSQKTPEEILRHSDRDSLSFGEALVTCSRLSAKIDNTAIQDGYTLYHHAFFFTASGNWSVVQQGMNPATHFARRYHWLGERVLDFACEPHSGICGIREREVLNLVARESKPCQEGIVAMLREGFPVVRRYMESTLRHLVLPKRHGIEAGDFDLSRIEKTVAAVCEKKPSQFLEVLGAPGVGEKTLRALVLTAEIVLGTPPSYTDPVSFSFAHGGKDGTPFPVDRRTYDATIDFLGQVVERMKVGISEKRKMYEQLRLLSGGEERRWMLWKH
ncbi:MAG: DUF763 domain-containing protein [Candidatus Caldatribacterium sp.]|nr:DUF763 domain-containing protein [Candidatus Caldatribacterium sp.]